MMADFRAMKPLSSLPEDLQKKLLSLRGPQVAPTKKPVSIRLSADVVAGFKATGAGWQTRIDEVLKKHLAKQKRTGTRG